MMGMSAGAKNMFGAIPGTVKPEYHFRFPNHEDFARMIVDLNDFFRPVLTFCDAVVGMEGNGPTAGSPREIGAILVSKCPHSLDLVCSHIIGLDPQKVPTLWAAEERGYISLEDEDSKKLAEDLKISDYKNIETAGSILFAGRGSILGRVRGDILKFLLSSRPHLKPKECVGCKECFKICPANAITMVKGKPKIDRKKCIKCFCCQEFCPKGALKVKRTAIAKLLNK
jgi:ferredoxin